MGIFVAGAVISGKDVRKLSQFVALNASLLIGIDQEKKRDNYSI